MPISGGRVASGRWPLKTATARILGVLVGLALSAAAAHAAELDAAPANEWNETVLAIAEAEDGFLTLKGLRTVTMMHIAMHDALVAIQGRYEPYAYRSEAPTADPVAAATQAAYAIASRAYPDQADTLEALRKRWLVGAEPAAAKTAIALGDAAAAAIWKDRDGDGWDREADYRWHPMAPGVYAEFHEHSGTPQGFIFGAGWAKARGFALTKPSQFRVPPPPAIASETYAEAFAEVKRVGRFQSLDRTPDQTHLALWWKDFAENSHNRLARQLIVEDSISLHEAVRLLALLNMSIFDAYVASFDNKFHYNHWRPYTAIRWADNDGNAATTPEKTWTNTHRHTYAFPSYPSAHGTACAAAMAAFIEVFGDERAFVMHTPMVDVAGPFSGKIEMQPPTRSFESFSEAATECGASRVYLGIHFRYDSVEGVKLGRAVGGNVVENRLRSVR